MKNFKHLGIEDALRVFSKANDKEKAELRPVLAQKEQTDLKRTLAKKTLPEQKELLTRLTKAMLPATR